jgi:hypothetical protein
MAGAEKKVFRGPAGGGKNCQGKDNSNPVLTYTTGMLNLLLIIFKV